MMVFFNIMPHLLKKRLIKALELKISSTTKSCSSQESVVHTIDFNNLTAYFKHETKLIDLINYSFYQSANYDSLLVTQLSPSVVSKLIRFGDIVGVA
jgi:hypothetical protein